MRGRSLARRFRGSFSATRCVALPERTGRARVSGRTLGGLPPNVVKHKAAPSAPAHARRLCHGLLAMAHVLRCGSCDRAIFARETPGAFNVPCDRAHGSQPPRSAFLARTSAAV